MGQIIEKTQVDECLFLIRQGNSSALSSLYDLTYRQLYALCYSYMKNQHDSEDALSDVYVAVTRSISKYRGQQGFNWLYTIAKNICLNMLRRKKRDVPVDFQDEESVNILGLSEEADPRCQDESGIIEASKNALNENELRIVILHAVNDMKFKDIAKLLGGKEATVRWQYNNPVKGDLVCGCLYRLRRSRDFI